MLNLNCGFGLLSYETQTQGWAVSCHVRLPHILPMEAAGTRTAGPIPNNTQTSCNSVSWLIRIQITIDAQHKPKGQLSFKLFFGRCIWIFVEDKITTPRTSSPPKFYVYLNIKSKPLAVNLQEYMTSGVTKWLARVEISWWLNHSGIHQIEI